MIAFAKVVALPATLAPNTLYLVTESNDEHFTAILTDAAGIATRRMLSTADVDATLESVAVLKKNLGPATGTMNTPVCITETGALMAQDQAISKVFALYDLPNVGDIAEVHLGGKIAFSLRKTTNGGNEAYRAELFPISSSIIVCYRRDSTYDSSSTEGSNQNNYTIAEGSYHTVDGTVYGSMRDRGVIVIVDTETMLSWDIVYYGFGVGKLRLLVEAIVDDPAAGLDSSVVFAGTGKSIPAHPRGGTEV